MEFAFIVAQLITGQETALTSTAGSMLSKLDKKDIKEGDCQTSPREGKSVIQKFLLHKSS